VSEGSRHRNWAQVVQPFIAACCLSFSGFSHGMDPCWVWSRRVVRWVEVMLNHNGLPYAVKRLKELSLAIRREALGLPWKVNFKWGVPSLKPLSKSCVRRRLHQLSRFARALPIPDSATCDAALAEHRRVLTSEHRCSEGVKNSLYCFGLEIGIKAKVRVGTTGMPSFSASLERTRAKGGVLDVVKSLSNQLRDRSFASWGEVDEFSRSLPPSITESYLVCPPASERGSLGIVFPRRGDEVLFLYQKSSEISLEDWEVVRENLFSIAASYLSINWDDLPHCRRTVVRERGWKTRVVTPEEAAFAYLCGIGNSMLLDVLRSVPFVRGSVQQDPVEGIDWSGDRFMLVRSLDLMSASDYMSLDGTEAILSGVLDGLGSDPIGGSGRVGVPDWLRRTFLRAIGSHVVRDAAGDFHTSRGALMGNPLTWPLLCMTLAWCHRHSGSTGFAAINGDDYVGSHTHASNARLNACLAAVGLRIQPSKDFLTRNGWGIFSEEILSVGRCKVYRTAAMRAWFGSHDSTKPAWCRGPEIAREAARAPCPLAASTLTAIRYQLWYRRMRAKGLDPCGPRWCGGAGFPGAPTLRSARVARGLVSQSGPKVLAWLARLSSVWATSSFSLGDDVEVRVQAWIAEWGGKCTLEEGGRTVDSLVGELIGALAPAHALAGMLSRDDFSPSLTKVLRVTQEVQEEVLRTAFWVPREEARNWVRLGVLVRELEPAFRIRRIPVSSRVRYSNVAW